MRFVGGWALYALCAICFVTTASDVYGADGERAKRVLMVSTGSRFAPGFATAEQSALETLRRLGPGQLEFYSEALDIVRFPSESYRRLFRNYLSEKYADSPPDLIILIYVGNLSVAEELFKKLFPGVPVVVAGFTEEAISVGQLGPHVGGLVQRVDPRGTIELILRLQPDSRRIVVIGGTAEVDRHVISRAQEAARSFRARVEFDFWTERPMAEMTNAVKSLAPHTAILFTRMFRDAAGRAFNSTQAAQLIAQSANAPVYIMTDSMFGTGAVGGSVSDVRAIGNRAGELAHGVLTRTVPVSSPLEIRTEGVPTFDWQALQRWGISEARLPPGSIVRNRPQSVWAQYQWYIIGALIVIALQAAIIADLLVSRARRRRAESELRESREFMEMATEAGQMGLWVRDMVRDELWANPRLRLLFGFGQDDVLGIKDLEARIRSDDRGQVITAIERAQKTGVAFDVEFRTAVPIVPERWLVARGRMIRDIHGRPLRTMGTVIDVTQRKRDEERLRESEESFRTLVETTAAVPWTADIETWAFTYAGPQAVRLLGYPVEQWYEKDFWVSHLHPDDREFAVNTCMALSSSAADFELEYRMVASSGKVVWVHDIVNCEHHDGKPVQLRGFLLDISERKQTEAALEQSENQVRLFVEHTPASVAMFDRDMRYVLTSRRWLKDYNLGEQNIIGRSHYEVFPEVPQRWKEIHQRCLAGAVETCEEDPFLRLDGTLDWIRWEVRPWLIAKGEIGGVIMFTEVITDRKRAEEELRRSEEWLRLAAEGSRLGVWYWDEVSKELSWDGPTRQMFGVPADAEITPETFYRTLHPDDLEGVKQSWRNALETRQPYQIELPVQRSDGSVCWIHARGRGYFDEAGNPTRMIGVVLDITERKQAESELQRQRQELAHITRVSTMGELAASLAHELNQPLTAILSNAQAAQRFLAADTANLDEIREILSDIVHDNSRAGEVIRRMRTLFRKEQLEFTSLDLANVVSDVVLLAHSDAISHNVRVLLEIPPDLPAVRGDRVQLQQVILNLLVNAFHAMGNCPMQDREVVVHGEVDGAEGILATVRDRGIGIGRDKIETIFQPFYTTKRDGLGMGLSISRSIIEAHGGRLWAESNLDRGATFYFILPISSSGDQRIVSTAELLTEH